MVILYLEDMCLFLRREYVFIIKIIEKFIKLKDVVTVF